MPGLNRVQLIGYTGKDPDPRSSPTGKKYSRFTMAVDWRWKSSDGEMKEATDWFNIEVWGKLGEFCQQYVKKGRLVYVEGRLHTERYEHGGELRYFTKVIARTVQLLDKRPEEAEPAAESGEEPATE